MAMYLGSKKVAPTKVIVDKQPDLNIQYGTNTPTDTTKLWVKTANTPSKVSFRNVFNGAIEGQTITTLNTTLPQALTSMGCAAVGTNIYLFGGVNSGNYYKKIYKFDITTNTITTLNATLSRGISNIGCVAVGTNIYLFGGYYYSSDRNYTNTIYKFDTTTDTITTLSTTLPQALYGMGCTTLGTNIYLFGGVGSNGVVSAIYKFDTTTNTITTLNTTLPQERGNISCTIMGTNIYLFGGNSKTANYTNTIYKFDTTTDTITTLNTTLPQALTNMGCASISTNIYLFGGYSAANYTNTIYKFDTTTDTITTLSTTLPNASSGIGCASISTNIYLFGGTGSSTAILEFQVQYTLQANELQLIETYDTTPLPFITSDSLELNVSIGKAFIGNSDNHAEAVEVYQYQNNSWVKVVS